LSGVFTSPTSMPEAIQDFDLINPLRYMIDISRRVYLEGIGVDRLTSDLWPLAVTAVLTLAVGGWVLRATGQRSLPPFHERRPSPSSGASREA